MDIVIIGCGNLAYSLSNTLAKQHTILQVYSRSKCTDLADMVSAKAVSLWSEITTKADVYIVAVSDFAIEEVAMQLSSVKGIIVHCSGATNMEVLNTATNYGVLYPLQTFSKVNIISDFSSIPIFIEANNKFSEEKIYTLANSLSQNVTYLNSVQRCNLHLAAVFSCNFTNYLLRLSFDLLNEQNIDVNYLRPLMEKTISRAFDSGDPKKVQTGPAARKDDLTIQKHLDLLADKTNILQVYTLLTQLIKETKNE